MDPSFIPIEVEPSKTPFGLDQLRRSYKTDLSAEAAIAAAPAVATADETFPNMFLMPVTTPESAESATRIDLVYMGSLQGDEGAPVLPAAKHNTDDAVQSASSSLSSIGAILAVPATIQYYAPTSTLEYFSFGGPGTEIAGDPSESLRLISFTLGDISYAITNFDIATLVSQLFVVQIVETKSSVEIVPGQYWQNTSKKTKNYTAYIWTLPPGVYVSCAFGGSGYTAGDTLSISSGGESASINVDAVTDGFINLITASSITFTVPHSLLPSSGGTGTGALFNVAVVT